MNSSRWNRIYWGLFVLVFAIIIICITFGKPIYYALWAGIAMSWMIAVKRGFSHREIFSLMVKGIKQGWVVITVVTLVGTLIGVWMVNGTVASMMFYGFRYLSKVNFLAAAFFITTLVSAVIGTSIGTTSTVGLALLGIGTGLGIPLPLMAGAVVSGAFIGDKTSPLSGITNLTSAITETELSKTISFSLRTTAVPFVITTAFYWIMGQKYIGSSSNQLIEILQSSFKIGILPVLSVILLMVLILFRVNIRISMGISIVFSILVGVFYQEVPLGRIFHSMVMGFDGGDLPIAKVLWGGGIISMKNVIIMLFSATGFNGIVEGIGIIKAVIGSMFDNVNDRFALVFKTTILSIISAMVGCNQALAVIVPGRLLNAKYDQMGMERKLLARTIMDGGVMLAPLIPWNVNGMAVAAALKVRVVEYIPFALLCYLIPVFGLIMQKLIGKSKGLGKEQAIPQ